MAALNGYNIRNWLGSDISQFAVHRQPDTAPWSRHRLPAIGDDISDNYGYRRWDDGILPNGGHISRGAIGPGSLFVSTSGAEGAGGDEHWASVTTLLHFDGTDGSTTITEESGTIPYTAVGNAQIDTAQSLFGGASLLCDGNVDYVWYAGSPTLNPAWAFGSSDFTIEISIRTTTVAKSFQIFLDGRSSISNSRPTIYLNGANLHYYVLGANRITASSAISADTWYTIAVSRVSGTTRMYLDGTQVGSSWTDSTVYENCKTNIGQAGDAPTDPNLSFDGWIDEVRITNGVGRYSGSSYTVAAAAFPDGPPSTGGGANNRNTYNQVTAEVNNPQSSDRGDRDANVNPPLDGQVSGYTWFERVHIIPQTFDFGNVVSELQDNIELFNAYRTDARTLVTIDNQAGAGITLTTPPLPSNIAPMSSLTVPIEISPIGPPTITGSITFEFDVRDILLPLSGTRIILFPYSPTTGARETLNWKTDVMTAANGSEKRLALRHFPRAEYEFNYDQTTPQNIREINNFLVDWTGRVFGVPLWWMARGLTADATISDTQVFVKSIEYADFRTGGLVGIFQVEDDGTYTSDVLEIAGVGSPLRSINFTTGIQNGTYTAGRAIAVPIIPAILAQPLNEQSARGNYEYLETLKASFRAIENIPSFAGSQAAYDTYLDENGVAVPIVRDGCWSRERVSRNYTVETYIQDFDVGRFTQFQQASKALRSQPVLWKPQDAQESFEVRQFLYSLYGSQKSFLLPTFRGDLVLVADVTQSATVIDVENNGYTAFVRNEAPYSYLVIELSSTLIASPLTSSPAEKTYYVRRVTGATEISGSVERLTVDVGFPIQFSPSDVERISLVARSRIRDDKATFTYFWNTDDATEVEQEIEIEAIGAING